MSAASLVLFAPAGSTEYAKRVAQHLEIPVSALEERGFEDGEHKTRPLVAVAGHDVYVLHTLHGGDGQSVNDKLCRLLFLVGTLKDHGAARVTAVTPYLCYARKDRRTQPHDPVTSRYVAQLFEAVGTDRILALEVHNTAAFENAFRRPALHVATAELFAAYFAPMTRQDPIVVVSPDAGGVKRADQFRRALERRTGGTIDDAFVEKYRSGGVVSGSALVGRVQGKIAIILDDLVSTGTTLLRAAAACRAAGARQVFAAATHGLFVAGAPQLFAASDLDGIVIADTVPLPPSLAQAPPSRLTVLDSTPLVAEALAKAHSQA
jgi:ribose-phosphate pyrophosphokinase